MGEGICSCPGGETSRVGEKRLPVSSRGRSPAVPALVDGQGVCTRLPDHASRRENGGESPGRKRSHGESCWGSFQSRSAFSLLPRLSGRKSALHPKGDRQGTGNMKKAPVCPGMGRVDEREFHSRRQVPCIFPGTLDDAAPPWRTGGNPVTGTGCGILPRAKETCKGIPRGVRDGSPGDTMPVLLPEKRHAGSGRDGEINS